jgi:hypothetical protein
MGRVTRTLFIAPPPQDRAHPGVGLAVIAAHVGLLLIANLYWPLQTVAERIVVQVFRSDFAAYRAPSDPAATAAAAGEFARNPGSITAQRFGRAATQLELPTPEAASTPVLPSAAPTPAAQQSTPLAVTPQAVIANAGARGRFVLLHWRHLYP